MQFCKALPCVSSIYNCICLGMYLGSQVINLFTTNLITTMTMKNGSLWLRLENVACVCMYVLQSWAIHK